MCDARELLTRVYAAFNARDIDAVLAAMRPDVDWPNAWEGGRVVGYAGVRDYWTRQWSAIDPTVEPVGFATDADGRTIVTVHAIVRSLDGRVLSDGMVEHTYTIEDGLIRRMDVRRARDDR
jgi:ketosteroid isomerase-like protein